MDAARLKLAVQKAGRLTDPSLDLLVRCGLKLSRGKDQLVGYGENMPLDVLFVRDDDIPDLVQEDVCDLGLLGLNVLEEKRLEIAPRLKRADLICDLVASGATLEANHLREVETVLECHAVLVRTPLTLPPEKEDWVQRLLMRIDGVQQVRESKYIMLHAPRSALPEIARLLPGSESPTIIPLEGSPDRVAVHAVCRENVFWETLERLKQAGASALLVLPVEKMLA